MNPSHLALKILCQPHMTLMHLAEYVEQEAVQKATSEFRADILKRQQDILDLLSSELDSSEHRSLSIANSLDTTTAAPLTGVHTVIFSSEGLTNVLVDSGPVEIGDVIFGSLARGERCRIPIGLAELKELEFSWEHEKVSLHFVKALGRFGTKEGLDEYRPPQDTLVVSERSRKKYGGSLTIKDYGPDVDVQAVFRRRLRTVTSAPTLSVPNSRGLHITFIHGDEVLREVMLLLLDP